jgi:hypothetical protein
MVLVQLDDGGILACEPGHGWRLVRKLTANLEDGTQAEMTAEQMAAFLGIPETTDQVALDIVLDEAWADLLS